MVLCGSEDHREHLLQRSEVVILGRGPGGGIVDRPVTWVQSSHQSAAVVRRSKTKPAERVVNDTGRNGCAPGTVLRRSTVRSYPAQGKMFWNR